MDTVKSFNAELSSLYEMKPPISKAKMTAITKGAIKAVKFYKHVVQSVEKFLQKCRPEYKIPGLYVIDSIVRQSRHQFGSDKDVFAPRFSKNITYTFYFIYQCTAEEKSKVIRVLNLWQKNAVFLPEVIQPLFDMADSSHPKYKEVAQFVNSKGASSSGAAVSKAPAVPMETNGNKETSSDASNDGNQSQSMGVMGNLPSLSSTEMSLATRLQHLQHLFGAEPPPPGAAAASAAPADAMIRFNKKLLDFDYDEEDDEQPKQSASNSAETLGNLLTNPDILRHLQSLQQQIAQPVNHHNEEVAWEMNQQQQQYGNNNMVDFTQPPPGFIPMGAVPQFQQPPPQQQRPPTIREDLFPPNNGEVVELEPSRSKERDRRRSRSGSRAARGGRPGRRSRSRSRGARRRSRSRSRTRRPRSRSREERLEREKDRDRKRRGLPIVKKECLSVCSTTLWVGHLSKLVQQEELSDTFGQYGEIVSIDLIPPRGCAFVCMHRRQDAYRALTKLAGHKLQGKAITLAWAPGKGVKAKEWKDFWEVDQGVSYVPWPRLSQLTDWEALEEGGSFDEETLPPWMRHRQNSEMDPMGFIPVPAGPPTPEMNDVIAPGPSSATTTLPANLPTYAAMGLLPMPLPPPLLGNNAMMASHLLGQSILAGLAPGGPPGGFFFNPHLTMPQPQVVEADDMELEEAEEDRWNEPVRRTPEKAGLLDRLRSLANHEAAGPVEHNNDMYHGGGPNLASSLRGAPLTANAGAPDLGIRMLRDPGFGTPGSRAPPDDPFMPRHLGGGPGQYGPGPGDNNFGPMRGRHFGGRGGGFRNDMVDPAWEEEPPRWTRPQQQDEMEPRWGGDRERHWDRDRGDIRREWSSPRRPPPLPARNNDRGRDRFGRDRGSDRRRSGDREPAAAAPPRERRRGNRWGDRDPVDPPPPEPTNPAVVPAEKKQEEESSERIEEPAVPVVAAAPVDKTE